MFGVETTKNDQQLRAKQSVPVNGAGKYRFFDATLLTMPIRSNRRPFFRTTCPAIMGQLRDILQHLQVSLKGQTQLEALAQLQGEFARHYEVAIKQDILLEDAEPAASPGREATDQLLDLTGSPLAVVDDMQFGTLCDDNHLPVVARNSLEDGRSTNLWYEQIVPRQSIFYTLIMVPEVEGNHFEDFHKLLIGPQLKQIGANASIGYGFCQFESISLTPSPIKA